MERDRLSTQPPDKGGINVWHAILIAFAGAILLLVANILMYQWDKREAEKEKAAEERMRTAIERLQYQERQRFIQQHSTPTPPTPRQIPLPTR